MAQKAASKSSANKPDKKSKKLSFASQISEKLVKKNMLSLGDLLVLNRRFMGTKTLKNLNEMMPEGFAIMDKDAIIRKREGFHYIPDIYGMAARQCVRYTEHEPFGSLAANVINNGRTCLYYDRLHTLYQSIQNRIAASPQDICIVEIGVFKGGGSYFMADTLTQLAPNHTKRLVSIDTFSGHAVDDLPEEGMEGKHGTENFKDTSFESVRDYLAPFSFVEVHQGRIQDKMDVLAGQAIDMIHLDVDIYEPTLFTLMNLSQQLKPGGVIVIDDFWAKSCPRLPEAVDEFMRCCGPQFFRFEPPTGQCVLIRLV